MKIAETDEFEAFELVKDSSDAVGFVYGNHDIGMDRTQCLQVIAALQHFIETGELPE
jgi:hypothetical protein